MNKNILIVNTHGLGDVVMTLSTIKRFLYLDFKLTLLLKSQLEMSLVRIILSPKENDNVNIICLNDFKGMGLLGYLRILIKLRKNRSFYSMPVFSVNPLRYNILAILSGAKFRVGLGGSLGFLNFKNVTHFKNAHKSEINLEIASKIANDVTIKPIEWPSYSSTISKKQTKDRFKLNEQCEYICIAPGSGIIEEHKRWPKFKFGLLARKIAKKNLKVIILGGPGEEDLGHYIQDISRNKNVINLVGKTSLQDTLDILSHAKALIANCNGISHLGSLIYGLEIIGIYGPTDPLLTGPYTKNLKIISRKLSCSPCYAKNFITGCGKPVCIREIDVNEVMKALSLSHSKP